MHPFDVAALAGGVQVWWGNLAKLCAQQDVTPDGGRHGRTTAPMLDNHLTRVARIVIGRITHIESMIAPFPWQIGV